MRGSACVAGRFAVAGLPHGAPLPLALRARGMAWFWVITQPNKERRVAQSMLRFGITHHLFKVRHQCIQRHQLVSKLLCAFPRYIVAAMEDERWELVRHINGVAGFVSFGKFPALFPENEFFRIKSQADENDVLNIVESGGGCRFQSNQKVHIDNGTAFSGHFGWFQYLLPGGNAVVMVELMGQRIPVSVREKDLFEVQRFKYRARRRRQQPKRNQHSRPKHVEFSVAA